MRHRVLLASSMLLSVLSLVALPAQADAPTPTATVTFEDLGNCLVQVTYSWSGFTGQNLSAYYGVRWAGPVSGSEFTFSVSAYPETGSASPPDGLTHTFDLTGSGSNFYYGAGELTKRGRLVSGSLVRSSTGASLSC